MCAKGKPARPLVAAEQKPAWRPRLRQFRRWSGAGATKAGKSSLESDAPVKAAEHAREAGNRAVLSGSDKAGSGRREWRDTLEVPSAEVVPVKPHVQHVAVGTAERAIVHYSGCAQATVWSLGGRVPDSTISDDRQ